jgi:hypothetical protein
VRLKTRQTARHKARRDSEGRRMETHFRENSLL